MKLPRRRRSVPVARCCRGSAVRVRSGRRWSYVPIPADSCISTVQKKNN